MKKTFICFVSAFCMAILALSGAAEAKTYKFYGLYPEDSYITQGLQKAVDEIKAKTNGKIAIKIYPNCQLGNYEESVDEIRQGTIDFGATWLGKRFDPRLELVNLPGLAPIGYDQQRTIWYADNSPFKKEVASYVEALGIHSLGPWPEPYATIFFAKGKRPKNIEDNDNKKCQLRAPGLELYREPYAALGYQMLTMDFSEVFNAMQTGQIDGATGFILEQAVLQGKGIVTGVEITKINCNPSWLLCNKELWESFSPEEQKIINGAFAKFGGETLKKMDQKDKEYSKILKERGVEVIEHSDKFNVERAAYLRKTVWPKHTKEFGADTLKKLDEYVVVTEKVRFF